MLYFILVLIVLFNETSRLKKNYILKIFHPVVSPDLQLISAHVRHQSEVILNELIKKSIFLVTSNDQELVLLTSSLCFAGFDFAAEVAYQLLVS